MKDLSVLGERSRQARFIASDFLFLQKGFGQPVQRSAVCFRIEVIAEKAADMIVA